MLFADKPKGPSSVDIKISAIRVRLLVLEITSALLSLGAFLLGAHSEETHEALNLGSVSLVSTASENFFVPSCFPRLTHGNVLPSFRFPCAQQLHAGGRG